MIQTHELLQPEGPLTPDLFPDDAPLPTTEVGGLHRRLASYIQQAEGKVALVGGIVETDAAVRAWALHLAFHDAYLIRVSKPQSEDSKVPILGAQTYHMDQMKALLALSAYYAGEYEALLPIAEQEPPRGPVGGRTKNVFSWY